MINNNPNNATGPRTETGKQTSARNAIKHGCCSTDTLILPTERIEDFQALEATWFESYSPMSPARQQPKLQRLKAPSVLIGSHWHREA